MNGQTPSRAFQIRTDNSESDTEPRLRRTEAARGFGDNAPPAKNRPNRQVGNR